MRVTRLVVILLLFWSCSNRDGDISQIAPCSQIGFDSLTLDDVKINLIKEWKYSYSFTNDTCFILDEDWKVPSKLLFHTCDEPTTPMADDAYNVFLGICYMVEDSSMLENGHLLFNDLKASDKVMVLTYSQLSKNLFFISKLNKDSLVIEFQKILTINGKEVTNARSLYLPSEHKETIASDGGFSVRGQCSGCHVIFGDSIPGVVKWPTMANFDSAHIVKSVKLKHDPIFKFDKLRDHDIDLILKSLEETRDRSVKPGK